ncbi:hypothetical protein ACMD2_04951, partial [Ananas comosus]
KTATCCSRIRRRRGQADDGSTEKRIRRHVVLIPYRPRWRHDADVELLPQVLPVQQLRPEVPHPHIVERKHDRRPGLREHLDRVSAHRFVLPYGEKRVAVQVIGLDARLGVLEDDLHIIPVRHVDDIRRSDHRCVWLGRLVPDDLVPEFAPGNAKVLGELERRRGAHVRHTVEPVPALPVDAARGVYELDGPGDFDGAVVVGPLRVGPCGAGGEVPPEGPPLVETPRPAGRCRRNFLRRRCGRRSRVPDDGSGGEEILGKARRRHHIVVSRGPVHVERVIIILHGVRSVHLYELHGVILNPEVQGGFGPDIADSEPVRLSGLDGEQRGVVAAGCSVPAAVAVNEDTSRTAEGEAGVEAARERLVGLGLPVANEDGEVVGRRGEGDGDEEAAVDPEAAEAPRGLLRADRGEVEEAADLVLHLEVVSEVPAGRDGAVRPGHAVLPRVLPLLDAIPTHEEWLVEKIVHIHNNVIVGGRVDVRAGELAVDEDGLLGKSQRRDRAVRDVPREVEIRVLAVHGRPPADETQE